MTFEVVGTGCIGNDLFTLSFGEFVGAERSRFNFNQALSVCEDQGGDLARISSQEENQLIFDLRGAEIIDVWIGVDAIGQGLDGTVDPTKFKFTDGVLEGEDFFAVANVFPWGPDFPGTDAAKECVVLTSNDDFWRDKLCTDIEVGVACRVVNAAECQVIDEEEENTDEDLSQEEEFPLGILALASGGFLGIFSLLVLISFLVFKRRQRKQFKLNLQPIPYGRGVRNIEVSGIAPPKASVAVERGRDNQFSNLTQQTMMSDNFSIKSDDRIQQSEEYGSLESSRKQSGVTHLL